MRGRILKTITATTLAGIMLVAGNGCGSTFKKKSPDLLQSGETFEYIARITRRCYKACW